MIKNLKQLRSEFKISQQTLADAVGVSQQSINKYENQSVEPDIAVLIKIADYFSVSLDYLVGRNITQDFYASPLTKDEKTFFAKYKNLNKRERDIIKLLIENHK